MTASAEIVLNQVGYLPGSTKIALIEGEKPGRFQVMDARTGALAFEGETVRVEGDLGAYLQADFSALNASGQYLVVTRAPDVLTSERFSIGHEVYDAALGMVRRYFRAQRCGDTYENYLGQPCHLDDSRMPGDGGQWDATGGWHDASDLRKWVDATSFGLHGLSAMLADAGIAEQGALRSELDWGVRYFLKMQDADDLWMVSAAQHTGAGVRKENRLTDNRPGTEDDRELNAARTRTSAQYRIVIALALQARQAAAGNPQLAAQMQASAERGFKAARAAGLARTPQDFSVAVLAALALDDILPEQGYRAIAVELARALRGLQVVPGAGIPGGAVGHFWQDDSRQEFFRQIFDTNWFLIAWAELLERFPDHADADEWKAAIRLHVDSYLSPISRRNAFGLVPYGIYAQAPSGGRARDGTWYRYFMLPGDATHNPSPNWWVGINANIASHGVGLVRAARVLREPAYAAIAQRQLDWILGCNSFGKSTMTGAGTQQAVHYAGGQPFPKTPPLDGGVRNGFGGDELDRPIEKAGSWQTSEYWTPMTGMTAWLMSELKIYHHEGRAVAASPPTPVDG